MKCGFTVSSRSFKKAVERNKIKRLLRESYRLNKQELKLFLIENNLTLWIFITYRGKKIPLYSEIGPRMEELLKKLLKIAHENVA